MSTGYCGTVEMLSTRDADNKHYKHVMATMGYRCIAEHFHFKQYQQLVSALDELICCNQVLQRKILFGLQQSYNKFFHPLNFCSVAIVLQLITYWQKFPVV